MHLLEGATTVKAHITKARPCSLALYVYPELSKLADRLLEVGKLTYGADGDNVSCAEQKCLYDSFGRLNSRIFTGDVAIYQRLLHTCPRTSDASRADVFLFPIPLGTLQVLLWRAGQSHRALQEAAQLSASLLGSGGALAHFDAAHAHRHIILFSNDVQFFPKSEIFGDAAALTMGAVVVHLGDDHSLMGPKNRQQDRPGTVLTNDLTVPYRTSQWMYFGYPPPRQRKRWLLSGNLNIKKSVFRGKLAKTLASAARVLNVTHRLNVSLTNLPPREAAMQMMESVFCLAPTGDSKGFTARFYYALLHDCLPVRVDGWTKRRVTAIGRDVAWPFPSLVNWSRLVVDFDGKGALNTSTTHGLLPMLLSISQSEVRQRLRYLRSISHWFLYDEPRYVGRDAPAALIHELELRARTNFSRQREAPAESELA